MCWYTILNSMPNLTNLLSQVFPDKQDYILERLSDALRSRRGEALIAPKINPLTLYSAYPDCFEENGQRNFHTLTNKLSYIHDLGCNALHLLPFFPSPLVDGGFDITSFTEVREDLGTIGDFENFIKEATKLDVRVFIDLVGNHVSRKHPWFERAQVGEVPYKDFFITTDQEPELIEIKDSVAYYDLGDKKCAATIIFPEQAGNLPHWIKGTDNRWYFHTFYPHQIDLNWNNPDVFIAITQVIEFWTSKGVSIRLDAAPHLDKQLEGVVKKNSPRNHVLIQLLRGVQLLTNPQSLLISEVVDDHTAISTYLHSEDALESDYVYNFYTLNGLWTALATGDGSELLKSLALLSGDKCISWISFLRSHDALMLGFVDDAVVKNTHKILIDRGRPFGKGLEIAGRLASFLQNNPLEIVFAHFLLASLPGSIALFYGDEIGKTNVSEFVESEYWRKKHLTGDQNLAPDQRDLGRGIVYTAEYYSSKGQYLYTSIQKILHARAQYLASDSPTITLPDTPSKELITILHQVSSTVTVYANTGYEFVKIPFAHEGSIVLNINQAMVKSGELLLPPRSGVWVQSRIQSR